jgi:metallo-beta-lactamase class B
MAKRALLAALLLASCVGPHDVPWEFRTWNRAFEPFRVAGNVHFVGTDRMGIFLIATPEGHILLDSGFEKNVPELRKSVERLGFKFGDIKILLASHAHIDHVQGHALVRRLTGARVLASAEDALVIGGGGKGDWAYGDRYAWEPCPVDGVVADGERVSLGGTTLVAHLTPGHTKGATTWTTTVTENGRPLNVVFYASGTIPPGARLKGNRDFPGVIPAYEHSFAVWKSLPCDVFLGAHGNFFDLEAKWKRLRSGSRENPFIDPDGYRREIANAERQFQDAAPSVR